MDKKKEISIRDELSQFTLSLTQHCLLQCGFCGLWKKEQNDVAFLSLIESRRFLKIYPQKRLYNICGGDPVLHPHIDSLLAFLDTNGIKTRLWTTGLGNVESYLRLKKWVGQFCIYLPINEEKGYRELSGSDRLSEVKELIEQLQSEHLNIKIFTRVVPTTIQELPLLYEYCYEKKIDLDIHYYKDDEFSPESIKYLDRFRGLRYSRLVKMQKSDPQVCAAISLESESPINYLKNRLWNKPHLFERIWG